MLRPDSSTRKTTPLAPVLAVPAGRGQERSECAGAPPVRCGDAAGLPRALPDGAAVANDSTGTRACNRWNISRGRTSRRGGWAKSQPEGDEGEPPRLWSTCGRRRQRARGRQSVLQRLAQRLWHPTIGTIRRSSTATSVPNCTSGAITQPRAQVSGSILGGVDLPVYNFRQVEEAPQRQMTGVAERSDVNWSSMPACEPP
jgi:hypothetical protein